MSGKHPLHHDFTISPKKPKLTEFDDENEETDFKVNDNELSPTVKKPEKSTFKPEDNGCSFADLCDEPINTEKFITIGYSFQSKFETKKKEFSVTILYVKDDKNNIGELVLYDKSNEDMKIEPGSIVEITNFAIKKEIDDTFYKIHIKSLSQIEVLFEYELSDLSLHNPNSLDEMEYCYSKCHLKFVSEKEKEVRNGTEVKSFEFETTDEKRIQLSFWGANIIFCPSEPLIQNTIYAISHATKNPIHPKFFDMCLTAHEATIIEKTKTIVDGIEEEEKGELLALSSFVSFDDSDLLRWRKGTFLATTDSVVDLKHHGFTIGISDKSKGEDEKILAMAASYDNGVTKLEKGQMFNCHIRVSINETGSLHGALHQIAIISNNNKVGKTKFLPKHSV